MKKLAAFILLFLVFHSLRASDFVYRVHFVEAKGLERLVDRDEKILKNQIKIIEKIFQDNFNPTGFKQINSRMLETVRDASSGGVDFSDDDDIETPVVNKIIINKLNITHSLRGEINNMGDAFYVKVVFNAVSPSLRRIAVGNFDCAVSDSLAKCTREFARKFAQNPAIIEEGKRANTVVQQDEEKEKPRLIYGFLNVFPSDIGRYKEIPSEIIKKINASDVFKDQDCEEWRVPTENEIALLASESLILKKSEKYMTDKTSSGHLRPVAGCKKSQKGTASQNNNLPQSAEPEVVYGFLKVFPKDLGVKDLGEFTNRPTDIVAKINSSSDTGIYGCKNWRIPTENEVALLAAIGIILKADDYLSIDGKDHGLLRLVADMPGYESESENQKNGDQGPEKETAKTHPDKKTDNTAEQRETAEPESDLKLEQASRSKQEEAASKPAVKGCSVDIFDL